MASSAAVRRIRFFIAIPNPAKGSIDLCGCRRFVACPSVSGSSPNLIRALEEARRIGVSTVGLLGKDGGAARRLCDHCVIVRDHDYGWVESAQEQQASENGNAGRGGEDQGHGEGDDAIELSANGAGPL